MEKLGRRVVKISSLILPNRFADRLKDPAVKELAKSLKDGKTILMHDPTVRQRDMQVAAGVDRIAAHRINKVEEIEVLMVDGTDAEIQKLTLEENLRRRSDSAAQRKKMLADLVETEKQIDKDRREAEKQAKGKPEKRKPGRPEAATTKAAKATGTPARTVRRAAGKKRSTTAPRQSPAVGQRERPPIDLMGFTVRPEKLKQIRDVVDGFEVMRSHVRDAASMLASIKRTKLPIDPVTLAQLEESLSNVQHAIERATPQTICLFCKDRADISQDCAACGDGAYSTAQQFDDAPKELRATGRNAMVSIGGVITAYSEVDEFSQA